MLSTVFLTHNNTEKKTLETSLEWISYDDLPITREAYNDLYEKVLSDHMIENPPTYDDFVYTTDGKE